MVGIRAADVEKALKNIMQVDCWRMSAIPALSPDKRARGYKLFEEMLTILLPLLFFKTNHEGGQLWRQSADTPPFLPQPLFAPRLRSWETQI